MAAGGGGLPERTMGLVPDATGQRVGCVDFPAPLLATRTVPRAAYVHSTVHRANTTRWQPGACWVHSLDRRFALPNAFLHIVTNSEVSGPNGSRVA